MLSELQHRAVTLTKRQIRNLHVVDEHADGFENCKIGCPSHN